MTRRRPGPQPGHRDLVAEDHPTRRSQLRDSATSPPTRKWWLLTIAVAVGVLLVAAGILGSVFSAHTPANTIPDMAGNPVTLDPGNTPDPATTGRMQVDTHTGLWLRVPLVGLDVPLAAMNEVDNTITPPGFQDAYWVRNLGASPTDPGAGTVFVVMHSLRGGGIGPGNYLYNLNHGTSRLPAGTTINFAGNRYTVTGSETINKTALPTTTKLWDNTPNRLVMITCLETPNGRPSTNNFIISATRTQ